MTTAFDAVREKRNTIHDLVILAVPFHLCACMFALPFGIAWRWALAASEEWA